MGLLSYLFGGSDLSVSNADWLLQWYCSVLSELIDAKSIDREKDVHAASHLALCVTMATSRTSQQLLIHHPTIVRRLAPMYFELKLYYDCLWQSVLLNKHANREDRQKISNLYAWVDNSMSTICEKAINAQPAIARIISDANSARYKSALSPAIRKYIHGENAVSKDALQNIVIHASVAVCQSAIGRSDESSFNSVMGFIADETGKFFEMPLLHGFDLDKCEVLSLPDDYYE
jgi:hypothetical protein